MQSSTIFSWTQAVLAVIVVVGCGVLLLLSDVDSAALTGLVGAVMGYYFGAAVAPSVVTRSTGNGNPNVKG